MKNKERKIINMEYFKDKEISEPKRSFVRSLWGVYDDNDRMLLRRKKQDNDIKLNLLNPFKIDFVSYTFGKDNHQYLLDQGIKSVMVDDKPIVWSMHEEQFRHKLEVFKRAMEDFDEIVFLDWDCMPIRSLPDDFWETMYKRQSIQAIMRMYHRNKAHWRNSDKRKVPEAGWVYIRDRTIPNRLISLWEEMGRPWSEEIVLAQYIDNCMDGWKGIEEYFENYEPLFYTWCNVRVCSDFLLSQKPLFGHFSYKEVALFLKNINADNFETLTQQYCHENRHQLGRQY